MISSHLRTLLRSHLTFLGHVLPLKHFLGFSGKLIHEDGMFIRATVHNSSMVPWLE